MPFAPPRGARMLALVLVLSALVLSVGPAGALAAQSTITQQDCNQARIRDHSGAAISSSRCEKLVGQSITLASTGFETWIVAAAGAACLVGAFALRRPPRLRPFRR